MKMTGRTIAVTGDFGELGNSQLSWKRSIISQESCQKHEMKKNGPVTRTIREPYRNTLQSVQSPGGPICWSCLNCYGAVQCILIIARHLRSKACKGREILRRVGLEVKMFPWRLADSNSPPLSWQIRVGASPVARLVVPLPG